MKYMHFKASCSYAALANLMERLGVDTEDSRIAVEMGLPRLFAKDGDAFVAGPMLQSAEWFDLWLRPRGFRMSERAVRREALPTVLQSGGPCMLGVETPYGKHAIVFLRYDGSYRFLNPTHEDSGEDTQLNLSETDLLRCTDDPVMLAEVFPQAPESVDPVPYLRRSVRVLHENVEAIERFSALPHDPDEYPAALNTLFRPLLLDGISMLTLIRETALAARLESLQRALMTFLRGPRTGVLADTLPLSELRAAAEAYLRLIERVIP